MKKALQILAMMLGIFLITVFCAMSMFLNTATNGELYYEIQLEEGVEPGVDNDTMHELDLMLAAYLSGDEKALDGTELFNSDEKAHMADVYSIFGALRLIKNVAFVVSVLILVIVFYKRQQFTRAMLRTGVIAGAALFFLPLICVAIWAIMDFDAAFTAMHHLLFTNDLWQMNPATDLMIRMLPEAFFMSIGKTLAIRTALGAIAMPAIVFIGTLDFSKFDKKPQTRENE